MDPTWRVQPNWSTYKANCDNPNFWRDPNGKTEWRSTSGELVYDDGISNGVSYRLNEGYEQSYDYSTITFGSLEVDSDEYKNLVKFSQRSEIGEKIIENYNNAANKTPDGFCSIVCSSRVSDGIKDATGKTVGQNLQENGRNYVVYNDIFQSARLSNPKIDSKYRGTGAAGAIEYGGFGTMIDENAIWTGALKPGDVLQIWHLEEDFNSIQNNCKLEEGSSFGHSFIFLGYTYDDFNNIIGMNIYDQGTGWDYPSGGNVTPLKFEFFIAGAFSPIETETQPAPLSPNNENSVPNGGDTGNSINTNEGE